MIKNESTRTTEAVERNWFIQLRLGGSSIPVTGSTDTERRNNAALIKAEYKTGKRSIPTKKEDQTLGQLCDAYIEKYEKVLSPSTIRGYNSVRNN